VKITLELEKLDLLAEIIAVSCKDFFVISLEGDLGCGKTTFSKSLIRQLGIKEEVTSPTFSIENQYTLAENQLIVRHIDLYRSIGFKEESELLNSIGLFKNEVVILEWGNMILNKNFIPDLIIKFQFESLNLENNIRILDFLGKIELLKAIESTFLIK
jgi:tRNA threonylcarbamoyladenosine biosynthesis protein TsaE